MEAVTAAAVLSLQGACSRPLQQCLLTTGQPWNLYLLPHTAFAKTYIMYFAGKKHLYPDNLSHLSLTFLQRPNHLYNLFENISFYHKIYIDN